MQMLLFDIAHLITPMDFSEVVILHLPFLKFQEFFESFLLFLLPDFPIPFQFLQKLSPLFRLPVQMDPGTHTQSEYLILHLPILLCSFHLQSHHLLIFRHKISGITLSSNCRRLFFLPH